MKRYIAEFIGTFALVFAGTGAIVIDETSGGAVTHVGVALTFVSCICIVGDGETDGLNYEDSVESTKNNMDWMTMSKLLRTIPNY